MDVWGFVDSRESSIAAFKGSLKVKVGSYQSLETGSCHRPVLSEYQYPFLSGWRCKRGVPERDSSICSESWIIVRSCCSRLIISVLGGRIFRRSKSRVKGRFGSSWGGDYDRGMVKSSQSSAVNLWTSLWKGEGSVGEGSQNAALLFLPLLLLELAILHLGRWAWLLELQI